MLLEVDGKRVWQVPVCSWHAVYWRRWLSPTLVLPLLQHPHPQFSQGSQVQGVMCVSEGLAINLEVPTVLSLGLIDLLAWFIALRNLLLTQSLAYYKRIHLGSSQWKRCLGWGLGRAMELPRPSPNPLSHRFHGGSPTWLKLWPLFRGFITEALQFSPWPLELELSLLSSLLSGVRSRDWAGLEAPNLWSVVASPDTWPPFCGALHSHIINVIKWSEVKVAQSCPTLWDPMNYTVHRILQARIMELGGFLFSRGSSQPRDWTQVSHIAGEFFTSWATEDPWNSKGLRSSGPE